MNSTDKDRLKSLAEVIIEMMIPNKRAGCVGVLFCKGCAVHKAHTCVGCGEKDIDVDWFADGPICLDCQAKDPSEGC